MGIKLKPSDQGEIYGEDAERLWDIKAVYAMDCEKIKKWLRSTAETELPLSVITQDKAEAKKRIDIALVKYDAELSGELEKLYADEMDHVKANTKLMQDAAGGALQQKAPTVSVIWFFWFLILVLAGGLELSFFSYFVLYKGAGAALVGLAVILLVGGLLAGHSISQIMVQGIESEYQPSDGKVPKRHFALLAIGILLIVTVVAFRWVYGGFLAGIVAALFGTAVTTAEAFFTYSKSARRFT